MKQQTFYPLYVYNLSIANIHGLISTTINITQNTALQPLAQASLNQMIIDNSALGKIMLQPRRNILTETIVQLDNERYHCWREIRNIIIVNRKSRDNAKASLGEELYLFFHPCWNLNQESLNTETTEITYLLKRYSAQPELIDAATEIGIAPLLDELGTINQHFNTIYHERNSIEGAKTGPAAYKLKPAAVQSYIRFCSIIEHTVNLMPTPEIVELFHSLDVLRKKHVPLVTKKKVKVNVVKESEVKVN